MEVTNTMGAAELLRKYLDEADPDLLRSMVQAFAEALSKIMTADLESHEIAVNVLLPGGATRTGMVPDEHQPPNIELLDPAIMGPPIVWLASRQAAGVTGARIVATEFES